MKRYKPKERSFIEQWLKDNEGKPGVRVMGGELVCYGLSADSFASIRQAYERGRLSFTRKTEGEYVSHTIDNEEQTWYIYDDLMEETDDKRTDTDVG